MVRAMLHGVSHLVHGILAANACIMLFLEKKKCYGVVHQFLVLVLLITPQLVI